MIKYDNKYYMDVVEKYNYTLVDKIDVSLKQLSPEELKSRWLCAYNIDEFISGLNAEKKTMVTMGIGINSVPHMGTLSQILKVLYLQKCGFYVQIVLGDLDVYSARAKPLEEIREIVEQYKNFIIKLGFDKTKGIIRNQFDRDDIIKTAFLLSTCVRDKDFYEVEEDINELYKTERVYEGMDFNIKQPIMLMFADFIHPGFEEGFEQVLVMSGIDEHTYVFKANEIAKRMNIDITISGLFSKMLRGLCEYPKMSKSIKKSVIDVLTPKKDLKNAIMLEAYYDNPDQSFAYQLMKYVSNYDYKKLIEIKNNCLNKNKEWEENKEEYIEYLNSIFELWK